MLSKLCLKFKRCGPAVKAGLLFSWCEKTPEARSESTERRRLTAKLKSFEPLDGFALVGDDLRLPYQSNGHEAHGDNAKDENEANVGLVSRKAENAAKPKHGKGSPSTRFDLLAVVRANPSRQRRRMALAK